MSDEPQTRSPSAEAPPQLNPPREPLVTGSALGEAAASMVQAGGEASRAHSTADDEGAKQDFLWNVHGYLGEYARFADSKAGFAGTIAGALLAALYGAQVHVALLKTSYGEWPLYAWLGLLAGLFLALSVGLAIWTVLPRLGSSQSKGFIFWNAIAAHGKVEELQAAFAAQSARSLNDQLLHHVFDISRYVSIPKYRTARQCILCLCVGGLLAAGALVTKDAPTGASSFPPSQTPKPITQQR